MLSVALVGFIVFSFIAAAAILVACVLSGRHNKSEEEAPQVVTWQYPD